MAKTKTSSEKEKTPVKAGGLKKDTPKEQKITILPEKYQTPVFLTLVFVLIMIFFHDGVLGDKVFSSADNIASASFNVSLDDANKEGIFQLWMPYIFCGMPAFAALIPTQERMYDYSYAIWATIRNIYFAVENGNNVWAIVFFYVIFAFSFYFLALYKFKNKLIALYCAVAAVFVTPVIQLIIVGHNSKMIAIMVYPAILLFIEKIYDLLTAGNIKQNLFKLLLYFSLLTFFLHVQMSSNHIQMLFYFYFATAIYLGYKLIYSFVKKIEVSSVVKTIGIFIIAAGISGLMYSDSYMSVREYNKYSIRGQAAITTQLPQNQGSDKKSEPLDYDYATNWSFSPTEVMTFFVPYWVGFGDVEVQGQRMNTYWGQMPFTTSPMYFGIITLLLGIIGIYYNFKKNILVQALTIISFIALILSFGRTLPVLFDLMFYHFPFFSSFRAPVMIQILINVAFVILAGFGIKSILEIAKDKVGSAAFMNSAKYIFPILALPIIISFIGFDGYYTSQVSSSPLITKVQQQGANTQQVQQYIAQVSSIAYANVKSEMLVIGFLLLLTYGACYLFIKGALKYQVFLIAIILFTLIDLWHIDFKTLHWDKKSDNESVFRMPDYVDWILKNDKNNFDYRVFDMQQLTTNIYANWRLQSISGYQGAKPRIYQDIIDVAGISNPMVWRLMNVKYFIADKPYSDSSFTPVYKGSKYILRFKDFLPKAYFVSSYKTASGIDILNDIKKGDFDPKQVAFLEKDPGIKVDAVDSTAKVQIASYGIHDIVLDADASGNNLLFLSEIFYPAGWKAFIDGQETEIYKTDYLFRSIIVPKGKHKIEFKFYPETYYTGKKITLGANILLLLIFGISIAGIIIGKKKAAEQPQV